MELKRLRLVLSAVAECLASGGVPGPRGYVAGYSFPNELLFAGLMASFIQVTAGQPAVPLAGWQS